MSIITLRIIEDRPSTYFISSRLSKFPFLFLYSIISSASSRPMYIRESSSFSSAEFKLILPSVYCSPTFSFWLCAGVSFLISIVSDFSRRAFIKINTRRPINAITILLFSLLPLISSPPVKYSTQQIYKNLKHNFEIIHISPLCLFNYILTEEINPEFTLNIFNYRFYNY